MQNRVKLPCGLRTGSGPSYNSKKRPVTCSSMFCDNEPTQVLEHITWEGTVQRDGALCPSCPSRGIAPHAEVEAARERGISRQGVSFDSTRLPLSDKHWRTRPFTEEEAAEIAAIKSGVLVETYISPGEFEWMKKEK